MPFWRPFISVAAPVAGESRTRPEVPRVRIFRRGILRPNPCAKRDSEQKYGRDNNCESFHRCYLRLLILPSGFRFRRRTDPSEALWRIRVSRSEEPGYSSLDNLTPETSNYSSLDPRHSSLDPRLLRKQQLHLKTQLPVGAELRFSHVAKRLQLGVDRELRNRMALKWKYIA